MSDRRRILDLLAQGKITVDDAQQLLDAIETPAPSSAATPRYMRIEVTKAANEHRPEKQVNIRVPIALVKSGMRLGAIVPGLAGSDLTERLRERGIDLDLNHIDEKRIDDLVNNLASEMNLDIDAGRAKVRITCE